MQTIKMNTGYKSRLSHAVRLQLASLAEKQFFLEHNNDDSYLPYCKAICEKIAVNLKDAEICGFTDPLYDVAAERVAKIQKL